MHIILFKLLYMYVCLLDICTDSAQKLRRIKSFEFPYAVPMSDEVTKENESTIFQSVKFTNTYKI